MATTEIHKTTEVERGSSPTPWIAFIVGILLVGAIVAFFVMGGRGLESPTKTVNVNVEAPTLPEINVPEAPRLPNG